MTIFAKNTKQVKHLLLSIAICLTTSLGVAGTILDESFEYANHDMQSPIGWNTLDSTWLCGYLEKDHSRTPRTGNWYAFTNTDEAWMFMPVYFIPTIQYRINAWAVADGSYILSLWAGSAPSPDAMTSLFFSDTINENTYKKLSAYVEDVARDCDYFGICAISLQSGSYVTIDDIEIDMVQQYDFSARPMAGDSVLLPGTQGIFHYMVKNTGYDPLDITVHPSNEYFTNLSSTVNGVAGSTFHLEPYTSVEVVTTGTLRPEILPGAVVWLDIMMTIPCNCNTAMVTFWVTPLDITQISENRETISIFPNPATDYVTIEAEGLQFVTLFDETGRTIKSVPATGNAIHLDLSGLKAGAYLISAKTRSTSSLVKPILKM